MYTVYQQYLEKEGEFQTAIGDNVKEFQEKIDWLINKWYKTQNDSNEKRLISPILISKTKFINYSIIADNLNYFKINYQSDYKPEELKKVLKLACLCGANKIADFILSVLKADYTTEGYHFILGHVSASNNDVWAKKIAESLANKNIPIPEGVYAFASLSLIGQIKKIFQKHTVPIIKTMQDSPKNFKSLNELSMQNNSVNTTPTVSTIPGEKITKGK